MTSKQATLETKLKKLLEEKDILESWLPDIENAYQQYDGAWENDELLCSASQYKLEKIIQLVLDIASQIIARERLFSDKETNQLLILGEKGVLPREFAQRLAPVKNLRNLLVHEYGQIDYERLYQHMKKLADFVKFANHIGKYLEKKDDK